MVLSSTLGKCTLSTDKITPATILKIIGFVAIPFNVDDKVFDWPAPFSGHSTVRIITANML